MDTEHFSLRWNNFHSNLATGFHALLEEVDLVDVTLAADGQFVQAHKIVLSVCSPYFKDLFKANPCKHPIVILKDVCHKELVAILQFMYQGEVNVRQEELAAFLKTAEMLQIKGLTGSDSSSDDAAPVPPPPPPRMRSKPDPTISTEDSITRPYKRQRSVAPLSNLQQTSSSGHAASPSHVMSPARVMSPSHMMSPARVASPPPPPQPQPLPPPPKVAPSSPSSVTKTESVSFEMTEDQRTKEEPVDYESDIEEIECKVIQGGSSMNQMLHGESSQLSQGSPQNSTNLFTSLAGLSQDSGGSQDGAQVWSRKYSCQWCQRQFTNKFNLKVHIRDAHSCRGNFMCALCGKILKNQSCLRVHIYQYHRKKDLVKEDTNISIQHDIQHK